MVEDDAMRMMQELRGGGENTIRGEEMIVVDRREFGRLRCGNLYAMQEEEVLQNNIEREEKKSSPFGFESD